MRFLYTGMWYGKIYRGPAVASLTVPGKREFHFPHFPLKLRSIYLTFPHTFLIFFLILVLPQLRMGDGKAGGKTLATQKNPNESFDSFEP